MEYLQDKIVFSLEHEKDDDFDWDKSLDELEETISSLHPEVSDSDSDSENDEFETLKAESQFFNIAFIGGNESSTTRSKAICLPNTLSFASFIDQVLLDEKKLGLKFPELLLSVHGYKDSTLDIDSSQLTRFRTGFSIAVKSVQSWIFTSGLCKGVDQFVSSLIHDQLCLQKVDAEPLRCSLVGFCNWEDLRLRKNIQRWIQEQTELDTCFLYKLDYGRQLSTDINNRQKVELDFLHDNFVFVRGSGSGVCNPASSEVLRFDVEKVMNKLCPVVNIVIGGDILLLSLIIEALGFQIPCVICTGTGGVADLISFALQVSASSWERQKVFTGYQTRKLQEMIVGDKKVDNNTGESSEYIKKLELIVRSRNLIVQWNFLQHDSKLETAILKAIYVSRENLDRLKLALTWNQCDANVRSFLNQYSSIYDVENIDKMMFEAIRNEQLEFIQLFLEFGFRMDTFLTPNRLVMLYETTIKKFKPFEKLLKKVHGARKTSFNLDDIYKVVQFHTSALHIPEFETTPPNWSETFSRENGSFCVESAECEGKYFANPFRELAIWAVFSNKMAACKYFWKNSDGQLMLSLLISELWKTISTALSFDEHELVETMKSCEAEYNELAREILNECWEENKELCQSILAQKDGSVGDRTPIDIAGYCEAKNFVAAPSVQAVIDSQWKNGIQGETISLISSLVVPFCISKLTFARQSYPVTADTSSFSVAEEIDELENAIANELNTKLGISNPSSDVGLEEIAEDVKVEVTEGHVTAETLGNLYTLWSSPVAKFVTHSLAYVIFLLMVSKFYIRIENKGHTTAEWIQFCFMMCYAFEIVRQLVTDEAAWVMKLDLWAKSEWNIVDLIYLSLGIASFFLNFFPSLFDFAKGMYSIVIFLMWLRLLRFYQCNQRCGPIWCMIRRMLRETIVFSSFFLVAIAGSGLAIALFSIDGVNQGDYTSYQWIFLRPYFMLFGELFIEEVNAGRNSVLTTTFLVAFAFMVNALLLNLLIAVYGSIYTEIKENSKIEWKTEKFWLLVDYQKKTLVPPPLGIIETMVRLFIVVKQRREKQKVRKTNENLATLRKFESYCTAKTLKKLNKDEKTDDKFEKLIDLENTQSNLIRECTKLVDACRKAIAEKTREKEEREMNLKQIKTSALTAQVASKMQRNIRRRKLTASETP